MILAHSTPCPGNPPCTLSEPHLSHWVSDQKLWGLDSNQPPQGLHPCELPTALPRRFAGYVFRRPRGPSRPEFTGRNSSGRSNPGRQQRVSGSKSGVQADTHSLSSHPRRVSRGPKTKTAPVETGAAVVVIASHAMVGSVCGSRLRQPRLSQRG